MSSVKLVIKNADFSDNAVGVIVDSDINLSLFTSIRNYRGYSSSQSYDGDFIMFYLADPADTWSSYAVDVSRYIGRTVRITYNDGYGASIFGNGAFLNEHAPNFTEGFGSTGHTIARETAIELQDYLVGLICPVESADDSNIDLTVDYTIPVGAKWLVFTSKSAGVATILAD
jgi:hypothetical protein